jgi:hypothetical protein
MATADDVAFKKLHFLIAEQQKMAVEFVELEDYDAAMNCAEDIAKYEAILNALRSKADLRNGRM